LIKYPEGADIFKVFNEIENLVVLLGEEPEETQKKVVKKVRESLKFNINRNVGNGPIHTAFLKLMDQVTAEQKIFLPSCDNNAYKALFKACEKIQDLDSNVLIREQMNKQQNSNLAISGHGTPSRQHSNRHQLFYPRSTPHMKHPSTSHISTPAFTTPAVTPSKVPIEAPRVSSAVHFDGSGGIQVPSTSSIALECLPSVVLEHSHDPSAPPIYSIYVHNCIAEGHQSSMRMDPVRNAPYPEDENDHDSCWYFAVNSDLDPHVPEISSNDIPVFVANAVAYLQDLAMDPVTGACPICGFESVHDGIGCPYLDKLALTRDRRIMMSIFRLSFQDRETQKIWMNQSIKQGCLKLLKPNELIDFQDEVNKQTALNDQRKRDARAAQASNIRPPPYKAPFPYQGNQYPPSGNYQRPNYNNSQYASGHNQSPSYGQHPQGYNSQPYGQGDIRLHANDGKA
jgi:hypothetical protein